MMLSSTFSKLLITLWYILLRPDMNLAQKVMLRKVAFLECLKVNPLINEFE